jgi:hypothetical protein
MGNKICAMCGHTKPEERFDRLRCLDGRRGSACQSCVAKKYARRSKEIEKDYPALRGAQTTKIELSAADFEQIRELHAEGWSNIKIGVEFGCSRMTIARVLDGTKVPE